jgi:Tol biopolymer transport system component
MVGRERKSLVVVALIAGGLAIGHSPPSASAVPATCTTEQITDTEYEISVDIDNGWPRIDAQGDTIVFESGADLTGDNSENLNEIFLYNVTAETFTQLTDSPGGFNQAPDIDADGDRVVFVSDADLTGGNADESRELYLWVSGSGLTQLTDTPDDFALGNRTPVINANGTRIAFRSDRNVVGTNADENLEVFLYNTTTETTTQLTNTTDERPFGWPTINAAGDVVAFAMTANLTGQNADQNNEIFRHVVGTGTTQLTTTTGATTNSHPVTGDAGDKVWFLSTANINGQNPEGNIEVFVRDIGAGTTTAVTSAGAQAGTHHFTLMGDVDSAGSRIAFYSEQDGIAGSNTDGATEIYLADAGGITRVTNTAAPSHTPTLSGDGTKVAFASNANLTGNNADGNVELFLATCSAPPDPEPEPLFCDGQEVTVDLNEAETPTAGPDVILGTPVGETINALGGADRVCGGGGPDTINGGDANDRLFGEAGNDRLNGGNQNDNLNGGLDNDRLDGNTGVDTLNGNDGVDTLNGNDGNDIANGGNQNDTANGGNGNDRLNGQNQNDTLNGQAGTDTLDGGSHNDRLNGGTQRDTCHGRTGTDSQSGCEVRTSIP